MKGLSDAWVKNRILWAAKKNGLPAGTIAAYDDAKNLPPNLKKAAGATGVPVLIMVDDSRWMVLGTNKIIANENGSMTEIALDDIKKIRWPSENEVPRKKECDFLVIEDNTGVEHRIWALPGKEFFAIFNILLRLTKKNLKPE